MNMKNRSRYEIIASILEPAKTGITKTKIMYNAFLSYNQMIGYLKYLQENDLLIFETKTQTYKTTKKGLGFLKLSHDLSQVAHFSKSSNEINR
jgi:predicted transcriptional regulator